MNFFHKIFCSRTYYKNKYGNFIFDLKNIIDFSPSNIEVYVTAFSHRLWKIQNSYGKTINYQRLEFLGDALFGTIIGEYLYKYAPNGNEGYLTKMRAKIISHANMNFIAREMKIKKLSMHLEVKNNNFNDKIYGDMLEALIGAIYIDKGYKKCYKFVYEKIIIPYIDIEMLENKIGSHKACLVQYCQKKKLPIEFDVKEIKVPGNKDIEFETRLLIDGECVTKSRDFSKKKATEAAAKKAFTQLRIRYKDFLKDVPKI